MIETVGISSSKALFSNGEQGAVVDFYKNQVVEIGDINTLIASTNWSEPAEVKNYIAKELATAALTELDIKVFSSGSRMYTIPSGVKAEAKRGLKWRKEEGRGGTKVGLNTARTLSNGGQIGIEKVRHIAKYFPRHEVDKKAKGYSPGEDGYPSNGRIAWALWGGDAGQRWASSIVERENKKKKEAAIFAGGYDPEVRIDLASFTEETDFYIRIRLDGTGIDRLYRILPGGKCQVWDDGCWDDMGSIAHDFITYDKALDDPYDSCKKIHVPVDLKTAIAVSALFDSDPFTVVKLSQIEPEETSLFEKSMAELDWTTFDQLSEEAVEEDDTWDDGLMASAAEFADAESEDSTPGVYTSEERSEAASQQVRDRLGRFAEVGQRVVIGGNYNYQGNITSVNGDTQQVAVELDNGSTVNVDGSTVQEVSTFEPIPVSSPTATSLDFSGILGEPRVPIDQPKAQLPGRLPPLTAADTNLLVNDWDSWVADQRLAPEYEGDPLPPFVPKQVPDINTAMGRYYKGAFNPDGSPKPGWNPAVAQNVYNEPLLRDWLDQRYANASGDVGYHNRGWYTPRNYPTPAPVEAKKSRSQVYDPTNVAYWEDRFNPVNFSIVAAAEKDLTPATSDVPVMYLAIVADDDPQAVMELVALVPANKSSNAPIAYKRDPGEWVKDNQIIQDLKSATPPPIIVLDNEMLSEVTEQIDGIQASARLPYFIAHTDNKIIRSLVAAGGLDRNRGNAEKLRRYWTIGKGGLKIRWNTPGDWTRCNRQLKKYMGPRAKGYCALRHKEMTGVWPGDKRNIGKKKGKALKASAELETLKSEEQIISEFTLRAKAEGARAKMLGREGVAPTLHGPSFTIPLVIPEAVETGDGRIFKKGSISLRNLPLPLLWQIKTGDGHDGSVVVGQILYMERTSQGIGNAYGVFDTGPYAKEAERLVRHGFIRGVSADMDKFQTEDEDFPEEGEAGKKSEDDGPSKINIKSARVMAVTIVPKPAFQECYIQIVDDSTASYQEEDMTPDGIYVDEMDPLGASAMVASGITAASVPLEPPTEWFDNPKLDKATPLTITDDGRVFGHVAAWHVDHIGMASGTRPPRSRSNYAYFHTGTLKTAEGSDVPVGQLTLAGGHAGLEADATAAVRHYDDTASAFADVHAGEDAYGIWVAGSLRPGITPEQVRAARASAPSGDWRPINGRLELVAVCQVNVPGFPIARARVASGQVMALVAAGANVLAQMRHDPLEELNKKVDAVLEKQNQPYIDKTSELKARFGEMTAGVYAEKAAELASRVKKAKEEDEEDIDYMIQMMDDDPESEMAVIPRRVRKRLAKEGKAMPDGSFPIRGPQDLKNAIRAYGRAKPGSKGAVRKHIMRRAKSLKREDMLPPRWSTAYSDSGEEFSIRERALAAAAEAELKQFTREEREALAKKGQALPDGSYPIRNESDLKNAIQAYGRSNPEDRAKVRTHIRKRARALGKEALIPENWKAASTIDEIADDLKVRAGLAAEFAQIEAVFAELPELDPEEIKVVKQLPERDEDGRIKYTPETQPRDTKGRFRKVLARLKSDLGTSGQQRVIEKIEEAENLAFAGDYAQASSSAAELINILERLDTKALNPEALENVKASAAELGEVIANLPLAFGEEAQKIRFSDVPPALQDLMKEMISRVEEKIGKEDADIATQGLKQFMSGSDLYNQGEISSEMSKLLRLLT